MNKRLIERKNLPVRLQDEHYKSQKMYNHSVVPSVAQPPSQFPKPMSPPIEHLLVTVLFENEEFTVVQADISGHIYTVRNQWDLLIKPDGHEIRIYKMLYSLGIIDDDLTIDHMSAVIAMMDNHTILPKGEDHE